MARCYKCKKEIDYFQMMGGVFKYLIRNLKRWNLPIFDCPHCKTECQETALTYYGFIVLYVLALFGGAFLLSIDLRSAFESLGGILIFLGTFLGTSFVWWKFGSILKEPHWFWGE